MFKMKINQKKRKFLTVKKLNVEKENQPKRYSYKIKKWLQGNCVSPIAVYGMCYKCGCVCYKMGMGPRGRWRRTEAAGYAPDSSAAPCPTKR